MPAKKTSKSPLTLPMDMTATVGSAKYLDVETRNDQSVPTPVRIQLGDAVRTQLAELDLGEHDIAEAVSWARKSVPTSCKK